MEQTLSKIRTCIVNDDFLMQHYETVLGRTERYANGKLLRHMVDDFVLENKTLDYLVGKYGYKHQLIVKELTLALLLVCKIRGSYWMYDLLKDNSFIFTFIGKYRALSENEFVSACDKELNDDILNCVEGHDKYNTGSNYIELLNKLGYGIQARNTWDKKKMDKLLSLVCIYMKDRDNLPTELGLPEINEKLYRTHIDIINMQNK